MKKKLYKPTFGQRLSNVIVLIFGICCILYYLILGIGVRFGQSLMFVWPVVGLLCIGHYALWKHLFRTRRRPPAFLNTLIKIIFYVCLIVFLVVEGIIFVAGRVAPVQGLDYIVVLGARVDGREPSGSLRNRIAVAEEYLKANPETKAVLSGGQGADEEISEAQCMYEHLTASGIPAERLILEDRSHDTSENLVNSFALIGDDAASVGLVTNDFHIFRATALSRGLDRDVAGIRVATSWISFPHYMMREFVGVFYDGLRGNLAF